MDGYRASRTGRHAQGATQDRIDDQQRLRSTPTDDRLAQRPRGDARRPARARGADEARHEQAYARASLLTCDLRLSIASVIIRAVNGVCPSTTESHNDIPLTQLPLITAFIRAYEPKSLASINCRRDRGCGAIFTSLAAFIGCSA